MTVGELMAIICKYASDEDDSIIAKYIDSIEVCGDHATLYFTYSKTGAITIYKDGRWD